eukprot:TRINITY_DN106_c0_g1_i4.p1 TRINITY_DN106_c0_g1~~TRINITY_DN106_c0_g1_i4.p1  ORF type:complete len:271 (-),score=89.29 TRINITY_DN106_c0_g1_i4:1469-2281(-)
MSLAREAADPAAAPFSATTLDDDAAFHGWFAAMDAQPPTSVGTPRYPDQPPSAAFLSMLTDTLASGHATAGQPAVPTGAVMFSGADAQNEGHMSRRPSNGSGTSHGSRSSGSGASGGSDRGGGGGAEVDAYPPSPGAAAIIAAVRSHPEMAHATAAGASPSDIRTLARQLVVRLRAPVGGDTDGARHHRAYAFTDDEKRALRVILNRSAAERSRNRKRARVECLEGTLADKDSEIRSLRGQVARLTGLVVQLQSALGYGRPSPAEGRSSY